MNTAAVVSLERTRRILRQPPRAAVESHPEVMSRICRWWSQVKTGDKVTRAFALGSLSTASMLVREEAPEVARELADLVFLSVELCAEVLP